MFFKIIRYGAYFSIGVCGMVLIAIAEFHKYSKMGELTLTILLTTLSFIMFGCLSLYGLCGGIKEAVKAALKE